MGSILWSVFADCPGADPMYQRVSEYLGQDLEYPPRSGTNVAANSGGPMDLDTEKLRFQIPIRNATRVSEHL